MSSADDLGAWQQEAVTLAMRFEQTGDVRLLREAVALFRRVAFDPGVGPDEHWWPLGNLATALEMLAEVTGDITDLRAAADAGRAAVAAADPSEPSRIARLNDLGGTLRVLAEKTTDADLASGLLAEAAQAGRDAISAAPPDYPDICAVLTNLSNTLQSQYERSGDLAVLGEAVHLARRAVAAAPADDPHEITHLVILAESLRVLGQRTGDVAVLREVVGIFRALDAESAGSAPDRAKILNNRGIVLQVLFERTGDTADLDEAVRVQREAVDATEPGDPDLAARLSNLGVTLQLRFERTGDEDALKDAATAAREAVNATPADSPERAAFLGNLGGALRLRHQVAGDAAVLEEAVEAMRAAVDATAPGRPEHVSHLANLCGTLHYAYLETLDDSTLDVAVAVGQQAAAMVAAGDPDRAVILLSVAHALRRDSERGGNPGSLADAARWFREAGRDESAPISMRVEGYRSLMRLRLPGGQSASARLADVADATALLPRVAPATLARPDREHGLGQLLSFAGDAAATAVAAGRPDRAVELLEQTRGILVADALDARGGDMARLRDADPELADQLSAARARLDALSAPRPPGSSQTPAALAEARRDAAAAWDTLVARAREAAAPDFLRPPAIGTLAACAAGGPVIYVYTSKARCGALILTDSGTAPVRPVPLPELTENDAIRQAERLLVATDALADPDVPPSRPHGEILEILQWARDVICEPVLTALGHRTTPAVGDPWPRVWWCPVGLLGYLPLHAAVLDRVVSSYAVTARSLAAARDRSIHPGGQTRGRMLVVPVPDALGGSSLPSVAEETAAIRNAIPDAMVLSQPTRDQVLRELSGYALVHFSCHGEADPSDPSSGYLVMTDHATMPLTVADIAARRADGELAFLSACSTGRTSPALSNEAVHLTGAFHLAGFRHVIGTLWPVLDSAASTVTSDFYAAITGGGTLPPDAANSAAALHDAIRRLRAEAPEFPGIWAAFTHSGP